MLLPAGCYDGPGVLGSRAGSGWHPQQSKPAVCVYHVPPDDGEWGGGGCKQDGGWGAGEGKVAGNMRGWGRGQGHRHVAPGDGTPCQAKGDGRALLEVWRLLFVRGRKHIWGGQRKGEARQGRYGGEGGRRVGMQGRTWSC